MICNAPGPSLNSFHFLFLPIALSSSTSTLLTPPHTADLSDNMATLSYTFGVAMFAAIGTFLFGFDTGIATTTIAHQSWISYMDHPSKALTGAVVAVYIAGEAVGALVQTAIGDRLGRVRFMQAMCVVVTVGTTIQTASVNMPMFLVGRAIAGVAVGGLVSTVPIYLSEISSPEHRGLIGGISGCGISFGTMTSNWVGMACGYAPYGATQWRLPLGVVSLGLGSPRG
jgi:MFS family permease